MAFEEELNPHNFYQRNQAMCRQERQETQVSCMQLGGLGWDIWPMSLKLYHDRSKTPLLIEHVHGKVGQVTCVLALAGGAPKEPGWFSKVTESKNDRGGTCLPSPTMFPTSHPEPGSSEWPPASRSPPETWFYAVSFGLPQRQVAAPSVTIPSMKRLKMRQLLGCQLIFFFLTKTRHFICYVFISICLQVKPYSPVKLATTSKIF